eukprot:1314638-Rhodomonas_salina.3
MWLKNHEGDCQFIPFKWDSESNLWWVKFCKSPLAFSLLVQVTDPQRWGEVPKSVPGAQNHTCCSTSQHEESTSDGDERGGSNWGGAAAERDAGEKGPKTVPTDQIGTAGSSGNLRWEERLHERGNAVRSVEDSYSALPDSDRSSTESGESAVLPSSSNSL